MPWSPSRREFLATASAAAAAAVLPMELAAKSPFRISVINDEIDPDDFGRVLEIITKDFGLHWVEIRGMWKKNVLKLDDKEVEEARKLLAKYKVRVTDIASPLFKVDWPGAPKSKLRESRDTFGDDSAFKQQDQVLERSCELAKRFGTDRVRCFDFWRLDDQKPYRDAIDAKLRDAAEKAAKKKIILVLENEMACNTGSGEELARTLKAVPNKNFMGNWDPGNAAMLGEKPYPDGYSKLPIKRIGHCHCKDIQHKAGVDPAKQEWAPMGGGTIDWAGQFRALKRDGYHYAVSLETHWRGAGTPEASTRESWAGMKKLLEQAGALA